MEKKRINREEAFVDEAGKKITSIVQKAGTEATVRIPGVTDDQEAKVTWKSTKPEIAFVDATGKISLLTPGIAEIVVTVVKGNVIKTGTLVVLSGESELNKDMFIRLGTTATDTPVVRFLEVGDSVDIQFWGVKNWTRQAYEYFWSTSDETIVVTDSVGKITALKPGVVTMNLSLKNKETGEILTAEPIQIVVPADMENKIYLGTSGTNTFEQLELKLNQRVDINFYGVKHWKREDYEYYWSSSDPETGWVDEVGRIIPVKTGTAVITLILIDKKTGYPLYVVPASIIVK